MLDTLHSTPSHGWGAVSAGVLLLAAIGLAGCGNDLHAEQSGIYVDSTTGVYLKSAFDDLKACTGMEKGTFEDLTVVLMPPAFPCVYYAGGCSGEYVAPNSVKVGSLSVWRHELVHYLLYLNTGSADPNHQSPLFSQCAQASSSKPLAF